MNTKILVKNLITKYNNLEEQLSLDKIKANRVSDILDIKHQEMLVTRMKNDLLKVQSTL